MNIKVDEGISLISLQKILEPKGFKLFRREDYFFLFRACKACQEHPSVALDHTFYCASCYLEKQKEQNLQN